MSKIKSKPFDPSMELSNESRELFITTYLELDKENPLMQGKMKRKKAYKKAYPEYKGKEQDALAKRILRDDRVIKRINEITKDEDAGIENGLKWTKDKAEDTLISLIINSEKDSDKLNALKELNKIRNIGADEDSNDDITIKFIREFGEIEDDE